MGNFLVAIWPNRTKIVQNTFHTSSTVLPCVSDCTSTKMNSKLKVFGIRMSSDNLIIRAVANISSSWAIRVAGVHSHSSWGKIPAPGS